MWWQYNDGHKWMEWWCSITCSGKCGVFYVEFNFIASRGMRGEKSSEMKLSCPEQLPIVAKIATQGP